MHVQAVCVGASRHRKARPRGRPVCETHSGLHRSWPDPETGYLWGYWICPKFTWILPLTFQHVYLLQVCSARILSLQSRKPGREEGSPCSGPGPVLEALDTWFLLILPTAHWSWWNCVLWKVVYFSITVDIQHYISFGCTIRWLYIYITYKVFPQTFPIPAWHIENYYNFIDSIPIAVLDIPTTTSWLPICSS